MSGPFGRKSLSFAAQRYALDTVFPGSECRIRGNILIWQGQLQPTALSRVYRMRIEYEMRTVPRVYVVEPSLRDICDAGFAKERKLPHVYPEEGDPLCLFEGLVEWNSSKLIAKTTVPWASLWLQFFEVWVVTNTWEGSGAPYGEDRKVAA